MYITSSKWNIEQHMSIIKIVGTAPRTKSVYVNADINRQMISKIVAAIEGAEKFGGRPIDNENVLPYDLKNICVATSIIFNSQENLEKFKKELHNIIRQG